MATGPGRILYFPVLISGHRFDIRSKINTFRGQRTVITYVYLFVYSITKHYPRSPTDASSPRVTTIYVTVFARVQFSTITVKTYSHPAYVHTYGLIRSVISPVFANLYYSEPSHSQCTRCASAFLVNCLILYGCVLCLRTSTETKLTPTVNFTRIQNFVRYWQYWALSR